MTEPCVFLKSMLYKGPSVLFMKWTVFPPGLDTFLPEVVHLGMQES